MPAAQRSCISHYLGAIGMRWRELVVRVCDPYRPELHYMRGPGPKWRAKYFAP